MDLMDIRREMMGVIAGMAKQTSWLYTKYTYVLDTNQSFERYLDFEAQYVTPYINNAQTYIVIVNVYNNTNNARAAKYHFEYCSQGTKLSNIGARVGGRFDADYGADFYAGATIEVYISTDVPSITV